jgi:hypothetical protein
VVLLRRYSLKDGRIVEFESEEKSNDELGAVLEKILARDKGREQCTCVETMNDATDEQLEKVRQVVHNFVKCKVDALIPYIVYRKNMRERICCECTRFGMHTYWRVMRADSITSADIKYLVDVMKEVGIYDLDFE